MTVLKRPSQTGFSLLEVLVAFAIMAMSLTVLYRSMGSSSRQMAAMTWELQANALAKSLLAQRDEVPPAGWHEQGQYSEFIWSIQSQPFVTPVLQPVNATGSVQPTSVHLSGTSVELHQIQVTIRWGLSGSQRQLNLLALRPVRQPEGKLR